MQKRPTILIVMAAMLAILAIAAPVQIMVVDRLGLGELDEVLKRFSLFQWTVLILAMTASILVLQASQWARLVLPSLTLVVIGHQFYHWHGHGHDTSLLNMSLSTVGFLAFNLPLLHPNILSLMNHPERRWWRSSPRRVEELPIFLGGCLKGTVRSKTYEVSETGVYVSFPPGPMPQFQVNETVSICLTIGVLKQIRCQGRVVRIADAHGRYPRGLAVEFVSLTWDNRRDLRRFVAR